jgi:hypothetical protein
VPYVPSPILLRFWYITRGRHEKLLTLLLFVGGTTDVDEPIVDNIDGIGGILILDVDEPAP